MVQFTLDVDVGPLARKNVDLKSSIITSALCRASGDCAYKTLGLQQRSPFLISPKFTLTSVNTGLTCLFARVWADQCSSQLLEFLRVTKQCERANNDNEIAGRGYL